MVWSKEYTKEYNKQYRIDNKEKIKNQRKQHRIDNIEKFKEYNKSPNGIKSNTIANWKKYGLIHENYSQLYDVYINTDKCDICNTDFKDSRDRCMDHDHTTNLFRQVLCRACNTKDAWKNKKPLLIINE